MQFLLKLHMVLDVVKPPLAVQVCAPAWRLCICVPGFTRLSVVIQQGADNHRQPWCGLRQPSAVTNII